MTDMVCLGRLDGRLSRSSSNSANQHRSIVVLVLLSSWVAALPVVVLVESRTVASLAPSSSVGSSVCQLALEQPTGLQQDSEQDSVEQPEKQ